jgi:hypothetical protein
MTVSITELQKLVVRLEVHNDDSLSPAIDSLKSARAGLPSTAYVLVLGGTGQFVVHRRAPVRASVWQSSNRCRASSLAMATR